MLTPLHPCTASIAGPKCLPLISNIVPSGPKLESTASITGAGRSTTNASPLLASPPTATVTSPLGVPAGTGTWITVSLQEAGTPHTPLKLTPLVPFSALIEGPKFSPSIVTTIPSGPVPDEREWIAGSP